MATATTTEEDPNSWSDHLAGLKEIIGRMDATNVSNPGNSEMLIEQLSCFKEIIEKMDTLANQKLDNEGFKNEYIDSCKKKTEKDNTAPKEDPNEEPSLRNEHLESFKRKLECEDIHCRKDDLFLLSFLRASKFDQDRAYKLLSNYYSTRKSNPTLFSNLTPKAHQRLLECGMCRVLPKPDRLGRTIILMRNELEDEPKGSIPEMFSTLLLPLDYALQKEDIQKNGIVLIFDAKYLRWGIMLEAAPKIGTIVTSFVGAYPIRYKEIHYVNTSKIFQILFLLMKPFFPKKFRERIHFHGYSWESVHNHIGKHLLPKDVGGTLEDDKHKEFVESLLKQEEKFEEYKEYWCPVVTETKL